MLPNWVVSRGEGQTVRKWPELLGACTVDPCCPRLPASLPLDPNTLMASDDHVHPPMDTGSTALVIAGHGSHRNPDSSTPAFEHAEALRETGAFAEVRTTFWKEEPAFREVLRTLESETVYVVPLFMSGGYFVDRILPRELRLSGDDPLDVDKSVHLTPPVGTHETMRTVILHRAETVTGDPAVGPGVGLAVVGHGTERHEESARSTLDHVARLRETDRFAEVRALFMDEPPYIDDVRDHFDTQDIVVVPLFVADGYHTREDIPRSIELEPDGAGGYRTPTTVDGRRLWYAGAVGTDPRMADVILERAAEAGAGAAIDRTADQLDLEGTP